MDIPVERIVSRIVERLKKIPALPPPAPTPPTLLTRIARALGFDGHAMWDKIHALCFEPDLSTAPGKLHAIIESLPCGDCKNGARKYLRENPIDISSPLGVARSTWNFHNFINAKLSKRQFPWHEVAPSRGWDKLENKNPAISGVR